MWLQSDRTDWSRENATIFAAEQKFVADERVGSTFRASSETILTLVKQRDGGKNKRVHY